MGIVMGGGAMLYLARAYMQRWADENQRAANLPEEPDNPNEVERVII